jgi:hypothetical protein
VDQWLTERLRQPLRRAVSLGELGYRRYFRLQAVGPMLYLGQTTHRGPARVLADGTSLNPGDSLGILHFNNARIADLHRPHVNPGFVFTRLLRSSLAILAQRAQSDPVLRPVVAFRGVTWIPPHGQRIGFEVEPLPDGLRTRWLQWHFHLLLYVFAPEINPGTARRLRPYVFWLTRRQLIRHFAVEGPRNHEPS